MLYSHEEDHDCMVCASQTKEWAGELRESMRAGTGGGESHRSSVSLSTNTGGNHAASLCAPPCRCTQWCAVMHNCRVPLQRAAARLGDVKKCGATHQLMVLLQRAAARRRYLLKWSLAFALPLSLSLSACVHACVFSSVAWCRFRLRRLNTGAPQCRCKS